MAIVYDTNQTPSSSHISYDSEQGTDWGGIVKDAINEARMGNSSKMRSLMTDPITQAKALPYLTGTAGALSGIPFGATAGTVGGRQLSNLALNTYGHSEEIPSTGSQIAEGLLAGAGDLTAIPLINKKVFGSAIGQAEKMAGVPSAVDIPSLPRPKAGEPVSGGIDSAIESVREGLANGGSPTYWKQIKDQVDHFYNTGKDVKLTNNDQGKLKWLSAAVQKGLNKSVSGRQEPAELLARSQVVPNALSSAARSLPWWAKTGIVGGATAAGVDPLAKALIGFGHGGGR